VRHWPSTATIAAAPWLRWAWKEGEDRCRQFADEAVRRFPVEQQPEPSRVRSLRAMGEFGALDGTLFYEDALEAEIARAEAALEEARRKRDRVLEARHAARIDRRKRVLGELDGLRKAVEPAGRSFRERKFRAAAPYFALLVMDGDRTGKLIGEHGGGVVSRALARFTRDVVGDPPRPGIVERYDGVLIYAGGDDVQAMLPLDQALPATLALREAYLAAFGPAHPATISAGLVFADHGEPLGAVIRKARGLLEDDAKEGNCRDSLALAVLRPSGSTLKIVTAFDPPPGEKVGAIRAIRALAERFGNDPDDTATRFLYRVRERYSGTLEDRPDSEVRFAGEERRDILRAEWAKGRGASDGVAGVAERVAELEAACLVADADRRPRFTLDGALIARFLADRGVTVAPPPEPSPP
jgi:CRISPR-associated protein Cmr2